MSGDLPEALKRAAELADAYDKAGTTQGWAKARQSILGWAEAVEALSYCHDCNSATDIGCYSCAVITKFIKAMLGGDDE